VLFYLSNLFIIWLQRGHINQKREKEPENMALEKEWPPKMVEKF
jgi:hypothetical protein